MKPAISVQGVQKRFKVPALQMGGALAKIARYLAPRYAYVDAVHNLSFEINAGERVAFVGPNGAGKSTTIKMLTGIMTPTSGSISVLGYDPLREMRSIAPLISVVFGHCSKLWHHLPVVESFKLLASVYDVGRLEFQRRLGELIELFAIGHLLNKPVKQLSLGERMRCELVASFLHRPQVIFLDEPTIGLDIIAKATVREHLLALCANTGCTLLLTSHDTDDIDRVCDRMILINKGQCVLDDSVANIKGNYIRTRQITLALDEKEACIAVEGVTILESEPHRVRCEVDLTKRSLDEVLFLIMQKHTLRDLSIEGPSLESVIASLYE